MLKSLSSLDYKRSYYLFKFGKLPFVEFFIQTRLFIVNFFFKQRAFFFYSGKLWFKHVFSCWHCGLTYRSLIWTKRIAIYKKKQLKIKNK